MIGGGVVLRAFLGNISSIESSRFPLQKFRNPGVVAESVSFSNSRRLGGLLLTEPPAPDVSPNQTQDAESKKRQLTGLRDGTMSRDQGYRCAASGDPVHWTSSHSPISNVTESSVKLSTTEANLRIVSTPAPTTAEVGTGCKAKFVELNWTVSSMRLARA